MNFISVSEVICDELAVDNRFLEVLKYERKQKNVNQELVFNRGGSRGGRKGSTPGQIFRIKDVNFLAFYWYFAGCSSPEDVL